MTIATRIDSVLRVCLPLSSTITPLREDKDVARLEPLVREELPEDDEMLELPVLVDRPLLREEPDLFTTTLFFPDPIAEAGP